MVVRTTAKRPKESAFILPYGEVIDAADASAHEAVFIKLPILITVAAKPIAAIVVPFIRKADSDPIVVKGPLFLYEPIVQLTLPLAGQKRFDGFAALQELTHDCANGCRACRQEPRARDRRYSRHPRPIVLSRSPFRS